MQDFEPSTDFRDLRGVRVLVLGAGGFLGRWVARTVARSGAELHVAVRDSGRSLEILDRWEARGAVHSVDLSREAEVARLLSQVVPAVTFNLAGYGVGRSQRDEQASTLLNARLPEWLVRHARRDGYPAWSGVELVHAGSALEYGDAGGDLRETSACRPTTLYGRTKLEGTLAIARLADTSVEKSARVRAVVGRLFTVFGAGERPERLFPSILRAARNRGSVALSPGTQRRDFLCAEDAAETLVRLALSPARSGEIVNVASGRLHSVREFALTTARLLETNEEHLAFGALPAPKDDMAHEAVNITRLREILGGSPSPDLEAGIARALACVDLLDEGVPRRSA